MKRIQGALRNRDLLYFYMPTSKIFLNYTDWQDVDEDMMTIAGCGGNWNTWDKSEASGVMCRVMGDTPTTTSLTVASSYI